MPAGLDAALRAAALTPRHPDALARLGRELAERRDSGRARRAFIRALALAPRHEAALWGLGRMLAADGDARGAERCLRRAHALHPARFGDAWQRYEEAAVQRREQAATECMERAEVLHARADHAAAAIELEHAVRLLPWHEAPYTNLAYVLGTTGRADDLERAVSALRSALDGGLRSARVHFNLAVTLSRLERESEASPHYLSAWRTSPDAEMRPALARWLSAELDGCSWRGHAEMMRTMHEEDVYVQGLLAVKLAHGEVAHLDRRNC